MSDYVNEYRAMPSVIETAFQAEQQRQHEAEERVAAWHAELERTAGEHVGETVNFQIVKNEPAGLGLDEIKAEAYRQGWDAAQLDKLARLPAGEVRVVDAETGGMKGSKLARFDMIPPDVLWELAEHYGKGEAKYPSDPETGQPNWQKGYDWRLSVAALLRHLNQFLMGEDFDAETGTSHLIAVMWHAAALRWFQLHGRGKDYRDVANGIAA